MSEKKQKMGAKSASRRHGTEEESSEDEVGGIRADPRSRKARVKHSDALNMLCERYETTLDQANVRVCEGRKVVYVLSVGDITEPTCFLRETPTPSLKSRSMDPRNKAPLWSSVMIPNGWKVAVVVDGDPWTAEVQVADGNMGFRFTSVAPDGRETDEASEWCETPGAAFKSLFTKIHPDKDVGRHNGKLYIGCHYENVQRVLRDYFGRKLEKKGFDDRPDLKRIVEQWLSNSTLDVPQRKPAKRSVPVVKFKSKETEHVPRKRNFVELPATDAATNASSSNSTHGLSDFFEENISDINSTNWWSTLWSDEHEQNLRHFHGLPLEGGELAEFQSSLAVDVGASELQRDLCFVLESLPNDELWSTEIFAFIKLVFPRPSSLPWNLRAVDSIVEMAASLAPSEHISLENITITDEESKTCSMENFLAMLKIIKCEIAKYIYHYFTEGARQNATLKIFVKEMLNVNDKYQAAVRSCGPASEKEALRTMLSEFVKDRCEKVLEIISHQALSQISFPAEPSRDEVVKLCLALTANMFWCITQLPPPMDLWFDSGIAHIGPRSVKVAKTTRLVKGLETFWLEGRKKVFRDVIDRPVFDAMKKSNFANLRGST